jgi:hypothetical protein
LTVQPKGHSCSYKKEKHQLESEQNLYLSLSLSYNCTINKMIPK